MSSTNRDFSKYKKTMKTAQPDSIQAWAPNKGDLIVGSVLRYDDMPSKYGDGTVQVCIIEDEYGNRTGIWLSPTQLRDLFEKHKPAPGDVVGIRFDGERSGKGGQSYKSYVVKILERNGQPVTGCGDEPVAGADESDDSGSEWIDTEDD